MGAMYTLGSWYRDDDKVSGDGDMCIHGDLKRDRCMMQPSTGLGMYK